MEDILELKRKMRQKIASFDRKVVQIEITKFERDMSDVPQICINDITVNEERRTLLL